MNDTLAEDVFDGPVHCDNLRSYDLVQEYRTSKVHGELKPLLTSKIRIKPFVKCANSVQCKTHETRSNNVCSR